MRLKGLIAAAGRSRRMDGFKPLMELNGFPMICMTVQSLKNAGIEDITVVTGYRAQETEAVLKPLGGKYRLCRYGYVIFCPDGAAQDERRGRCFFPSGGCADGIPREYAEDESKAYRDFGSNTGISAGGWFEKSSSARPPSIRL